MSILFELSQINGMELANRFVRSATWEGMATDAGEVTPKLTQTMVNLAKGGIGLIISGHVYIEPEGQAGPWQLGIYKDELIDGLKIMTQEVHAAGGKIVAQLAHAGRFLMKEITGLPIQVVSNYEGVSKSPCHELTKEDIGKLATSFAMAAKRAKSAGFDGVQIHSAHGYFLSQFLSPAYNRRTDEYGGDINNRSRALIEVYNAMRQEVGKDYPILIKINSEDCVENGLTVEDSIEVCKILSNAGIDAIELSGGSLTSGKLSPFRMGISSQEKEAYFKETAKILKKEIDTPIILVGGMRSYEVANQILETGTADYISLCRPLIREPELINRWKSGDLAPAKCKSDNLCFMPGLEGKGVYCVINERKKG